MPRSTSTAIEKRPLISSPTPRTATSYTSLDPNEDPVTGLDRVSSANNLSARRRREERLKEMEVRHRELRRHSIEEKDEHTLSEKYESLDYEIVENDLYRKAEKDVDHQKKLFRKAIDRWIICFLIGVCTACVAAIIDILIDLNAQLKFHLVINGLNSACERGTIGKMGCRWVIFVTWVLYNSLLVGIASIMVLFVSPVAIGSGISQIKCFLNGIQIPGAVRLRTLIAKVIGVICSVGGGLAAGKEGPMIHSGAVIAAGISQGRCISLPIDTGLFKYFRNDREKRDFVSAGAAAGVSAAFAAPIGGVLFSLEEGASFWNQSLTWRMVFTAMVSTLMLEFILSYYHQQPGHLSWGGLANFGTFDNQSKTYDVWEIPLFMLVGLIGGLSGALFNYLNLKLSRFRKNYVRTRYQKFMECILVAASTASIGFITLLFDTDCKQFGSNPNNTDVYRLWCPVGMYSATADLFFHNPEQVVKRFLHDPINSFRPLTLFIFAIEYFILTMWTYGLSVPSGIFIPLLLTGAAWGRLFGIGLQWLLPGVEGIDSGKYALVGAAAQLGGVVRMTISLTAIIIEATKDVTFALPIMFALMIAKWIGDWFNEGIYDEHIDLSEIPILGWHPPKLSRNILAKTVMRKDVIALERIENVGRIAQILHSTRHHGFPVVDRIDAGIAVTPDAVLSQELPNYGHLDGLVLRSQLVVLLKQRHFTLDYEGQQPASDSKPVSLDNFTEFYPRVEEKISDLGLSRSDEKCWIDLKPFMHLSPHRVPLSASLTSIFQLFRGLGLRFLLVVNNENRLQGIITRKDIARFKERRVKNNYLVHEIYISHYTN